MGLIIIIAILCIVVYFLHDSNKAEEQRQKREMEEEAEKRKQERIAQEKAAEERRLFEKCWNSTATKELVDFIKQDGELPYEIWFEWHKLVMYWENHQREFEFLAHRLPGMTKKDWEILADVINKKLGGVYYFQHDYILRLKPTKTFF